MADRDIGFLADFHYRPLQLDGAQHLTAEGLLLGLGPGALEVVVTRASTKPAATLLRDVWKQRQRHRSVPLLVVALYNGRAAVCGAAGEEPPVHLDIDPSVVERICAKALQQPSRHAALRFLYSVLPRVDTSLPEIGNEGFLTLHELEYGVPKRDDFKGATERAKAVLDKRGLELISALGFGLERIDDHTHLLLSESRRRAVAVLLLPDEAPDIAAARFSHLSPISYGLATAEKKNVPYVVLVSDTGLRLHPVKDGVGVAQRGRTETFVEVNLELVPKDRAGYLWLLFSAEALAESGSLEDILERAKDHATHVSTRLRDRVYKSVIPNLAMAIWQARGIDKPTVEDLAETYEMSLLLLFRLLFVAYAEDKELLPYRTNEAYRHRSLKRLSRELLDIKQKATPVGSGTSYWDEIQSLWHAIDEGEPAWGIPAYNGQLFAKESEHSPVGARLEEISLANEHFVPILTGLLIDEAPEEGVIGPVDFSALGVRDFGTIYEGLLENEIAIADTDLTTKTRGDEKIYWPLEKKARGAEIVVRKGDAYLHTASGARKATGSYYTKEFAVKHLLDHALEPALQAHIERLNGLDEDEAGEAFFDFRVADIAMGSGHFLVAAVDRIEGRLARYLFERPLPVVRKELERLRAAAMKELEAVGCGGDSVAIEDRLLLRRQIARRCIYGVDINRLAVQLARVSLWIQTFVPGLPLSFLDHNLVDGNSLVGIATVEEARGELERYSPKLLAVNAEALLGAARGPLERLARITDASGREIEAARRAMEEAKKAVEPARALFDILTAARLDKDLAGKLETGKGEDLIDRWTKDPTTLIGSREASDAHKAMGDLPAFHFPIAFPEVFLRGDGQGGFDCILGNPPWEEATVEEDRFWTRHFPGLHSLSEREKQAEIRSYRRQRPDLVREYKRELETAERLREALVAGPFPGMGTGDPDVYKAFCWRFWHLLRSSGWMGVVLPRSAFAAKGSQHFRRQVFAKGRAEDLTFLLNRDHWVFDDAEPRYTSGLSSLQRLAPKPDQDIGLRGPFTCLDRFREGTARDPVRFGVDEVLGWTDTAALPLLPDEESLDVFAQLRKAPRLDLDEGTSWRVRPHRELDATNDKDMMDTRSASAPKGFWPVFGGESFDIWDPDTGNYYAWADPETVKQHLYEKRLRASRNRRSAFSEFGRALLENRKTLPCLHSRIAFRDVARSTDTRTVRVALVPPKVFLANSAPYILWPRGDEGNHVYLVGVLSSLPLDWYSRRFVELHLNFHVFNPFPIPRPNRDDAGRQGVVRLAGRLAASDERFAQWAEKLGVEWGALGDDEKEDMIAELDAIVAHLYGLTERQLIHIFETFHEGWDYEPRLQAVLAHYRKWQSQL